MPSNTFTEDLPVIPAQTRPIIAGAPPIASQLAEIAKQTRADVSVVAAPPSEHSVMNTSSLRQLPSARLDEIPEIKSFREKFRLTIEEISNLLGSSSKSVSLWENGKSTMSPLGKRVFSEVNTLIERLAAFSDPDRFPAWLKQRNPAFDGLTPIEVIQSGRMYRLWELVFRIESGDPL
jgi:DNA-binding transcriptional regulator YiaG